MVCHPPAWWGARRSVRAVRGDSREVEPGDVFVAVRGIRSDGHDHVAAAVERGAAAVVVEHEVDSAPRRRFRR